VYPLLKVAAWGSFVVGIALAFLSPLLFVLGVAGCVGLLYLEGKWTREMQSTMKYIQRRCESDPTFQARWDGMSLKEQKRYAVSLTNDVWRV
jgi:hypothetical protein